MPPRRGLFITGTDTGVGKTHVACLILRQLCEAGYRAGAFKPACSGAIMTASGQPQWDDIEQLRTAMGLSMPEDILCPQRFLAPLAPPMAARLEGRTVDISAIDAGLQQMVDRFDGVVVEGAGGWLCPLTESLTFADWVTQWHFPVLIVARPGLGTINHTLLTIAAIRCCRLPIAGVILNAADSACDLAFAEANAREIEGRSGVPILGGVDYGASTDLRRGPRAVRIRWQTLMGPLADETSIR